LRRGVLGGPGVTDPALRERAFSGVAVPEPWEAYVTKVREASYRVTDADVEALSQAGCSQDEILEMTLAAALGAASQQLAAGLRALREAG
jgi:phage-related baseplate assembly protein